MTEANERAGREWKLLNAWVKKVEIARLKYPDWDQVMQSSPLRDLIPPSDPEAYATWEGKMLARSCSVSQHPQAERIRAFLKTISDQLKDEVN